jgi:hypothetical protein
MGWEWVGWDGMDGHDCMGLVGVGRWQRSTARDGHSIV